MGAAGWCVDLGPIRQGKCDTPLVLSFARHRASEAERVREACAKVAEGMAAMVPAPDKVIPAHIEIDDYGGEVEVPEYRMKMKRLPTAQDIAAAIRSLPIGGR